MVSLIGVGCAVSCGACASGCVVLCESIKNVEWTTYTYKVISSLSKGDAMNEDLEDNQENAETRQNNPESRVVGQARQACLVALVASMNPADQRSGALFVLQFAVCTRQNRCRMQIDKITASKSG